MARLRVGLYEMVELYINRGPLTDESVMLVRVRVAVQVVERLYAKVWQRVAPAAFPAYVRVQLQRRGSQYKNHILEDEIEDVLHAWESGEGYAGLYERAKGFAARRIVSHVRYGGRRDQK